MARLIWKELREKRPWLLVLALVVTIPLAFKQGYVFCNLFYQSIPGVPAAVAALIFGVGTFASELRGNTDFLYSRPISWKRTLAAKLITSIAIMLAAAVFAAIISRLLAPPQYVRCATVAALTRGVLQMMLFMGVPYLLGLACSVVLPGYLGGLITLLLVSIAGVIVERGLESATHDNVFFTILAWPIGAIIAMILVARFGLTLQARSRAMRYVIVIPLLVLAAVPLDAKLGRVWALNTSVRPDNYAGWYISPRAEYAVVSEVRYRFRRSGLAEPDVDVEPEYRLHIVNLANYARTPLRLPTVERGCHWVSRDTAIVVGFLSGPQRRGVVIAKVGPGGRVSARRLVFSREPDEILPSPNGKLVALVSTFLLRKPHEVVREWGNQIEFVDIQRARKLSPVLKAVTDNYWWQSDNEFGYVDSDGQRRILRVGGE